MISAEEIKAFLEGSDPEQHIVSVEFDYASNCVYKIKEVPGQGKTGRVPRDLDDHAMDAPCKRRGRCFKGLHLRKGTGSQGR